MNPTVMIVVDDNTDVRTVGTALQIGPVGLFAKTVGGQENHLAVLHRFLTRCLAAVEAAGETNEFLASAADRGYQGRL